MNYGILTSGSCLLADIVDQLHESSRKINIVNRLSRYLAKGTSEDVLSSYLAQVKKWCPDHPVVHIDDSDVVKPDGYKFESLNWVHNGSESTATKNIYKKGYHVTEATVLTNSNHPVSILSEIHSSEEKNFTSINTVTFSAMDRGYDGNKMFLKLDSLNQDCVIRLTAKRKLFYHNKWVFATELCSRRKGKVKLPLFYKGKKHDAYIFLYFSNCKLYIILLSTAYDSSSSTFRSIFQIILTIIQAYLV